MEDKKMREFGFELRRQIYFDKCPTYEEWCADVLKEIMNDDWYKEHRTREDIMSDMKDKLVEDALRHAYKDREMPYEVAGNWEMITF